MDVFTMVFLIVAITLIAGTIRHWLEARAKAGAGDQAALLGELEQLKGRVAQLEAIVTDPRKQLAAELDALEHSELPSDRA
jgi:stress response protein SCP2